MGRLGDLEEVERQTRLAVNHHPRKRLPGWGLSPNIARAAASREKKPQPPAPDTVPAPVLAPEVVTLTPLPIEINGRVLASFDDYDGLCNVVRGRVEAMGITRLELDGLSGNADGYSGKLLGAAQKKRFGKTSLERTLRAIGCKLVLVEDPAATAKIMAGATKRKRPPRQPKMLPPPAR